GVGAEGAVAGDAVPAEAGDAGGRAGHEADPVVAGGEVDRGGEGEVVPAGGVGAGEGDLVGDGDQRGRAAAGVGVDDAFEGLRAAGGCGLQVEGELRDGHARGDRVAVDAFAVGDGDVRVGADRGLAEGRWRRRGGLDGCGRSGGGGGEAGGVGGGDDDLERAADVGAGDDVGLRGGGGRDRVAVVAAGVAALPRVGVGGGRSAPGAVGRGQRL